MHLRPLICILAAVPFLFFIFPVCIKCNYFQLHGDVTKPDLSQYMGHGETIVLFTWSWKLRKLLHVNSQYNKGRHVIYSWPLTIKQLMFTCFTVSNQFNSSVSDPTAYSHKHSSLWETFAGNWRGLKNDQSYYKEGCNPWVQKTLIRAMKRRRE